MSEILLPKAGKNISPDLLAGSIVFLVSVPLCLGIALASGAPLIAGIISGIVGGILVGALSGSQVSVSGPAAGLTVICVDGISRIGSFEGFLAAVFISGIIQVLFSLFRLGILGEYCPSSVIKGMLAGIGGVIILKQIPHALGKDTEIYVDTNFWILGSQENSFTHIISAIQTYHPTAALISITGILLIWIWEKPYFKSHNYFRHLPSSLLAIISGVGIDFISKNIGGELSLENSTHEHYVNLPDLTSWIAIQNEVITPNLGMILNPSVLIVALTIAIVGSIESLLSVEAADKLDPYRRVSSMNRELFAQGIGNTISGLIGGIPVTAVMIRSSANIYAGGRTRISPMFTGLLLFIFVFFFPHVLEYIPLSSLAAILIMIGYKLMSPKGMKQMYAIGRDQFLPYLATFLAIVFTDLLTGVMLGIFVGIYFVLKTNHHDSISVVSDGDHYLLKINKDISFVNKAEVRSKLKRIPNQTQVLIDGTKAMFIDKDVYDMLIDFESQAKFRGIEVEFKNIFHKSLPQREFEVVSERIEK